ncbi:MAG: histidine triad nucleotide-binding protein [Tissierellia bacterium]|nr:histidine triad nucleotide-binding protein [Tissierellia bacterium]
MTDCIFCKIIDGEIPSKKIYEDELIYAFEDINAQAPVHFLVIPKKHIKSIDDIDTEDENLIGKIFTKIKEIAKAEGLDNGYRVVINCKDDGGQTVDHLHFHILGGRSLNWPPG